MAVRIKQEKAGLWIRIRIQKRIQEGKNYPQKKRKSK